MDRNDPEYSHLRSFGCGAYVHQVKQKISPRAVKGILVGYAQGTKGYIVWLLEEKKIVIGKDVVFNEDKLFNNRDEDKEVQSVIEKDKTLKKVTSRVIWKNILLD